MKVVESPQFGISVNVSAKNAFDLASVMLQYTAIDDTILLQVVSIGSTFLNAITRQHLTTPFLTAYRQ